MKFNLSWKFMGDAAKAVATFATLVILAFAGGVLLGGMFSGIFHLSNNAVLWVGYACAGLVALRYVIIKARNEKLE